MACFFRILAKTKITLSRLFIIYTPSYGEVHIQKSNIGYNCMMILDKKSSNFSTRLSLPASYNEHFVAAIKCT